MRGFLLACPNNLPPSYFHIREERPAFIGDPDTSTTTDRATATKVTNSTTDFSSTAINQPGAWTPIPLTFPGIFLISPSTAPKAAAPKHDNSLQASTNA
ncbi:hypothetical protein P879_11003 [Paragonimus westermani]|uniref:Uncharacterized protein n=1 Tax=Paragonimus westermani TaxID=34504 RepID=A0A8T0DC12_9TREM|nr:hypothetical protein P879_11003 [Paragonimus westermani]